MERITDDNMQEISTEQILCNNCWKAIEDAINDTEDSWMNIKESVLFVNHLDNVRHKLTSEYCGTEPPKMEAISKINEKYE